MTLYASGVFEITYDSLPADVRFQPDDRPEASVWLIGAVRGDPNRAPQAVDFARLPAQTGDQGFVQDVYLAFRRYLHQALLPLVLLIFGSSLLICLALPVFIRYDLVKPLQELIQGVARVGQGDLEIAVPVRAADEIGFLAKAFNAMVDSLRSETTAREQAEQRVVSLNIALARRVQDRTRDLKTLYEVTALANEAMDLPITLERELDKILELIGMDRGLVHLFDEDGRTLRLVAQRGFMPELIRKMQSWLPNCALLESVIATRKPVMVSDIRPDLPIAHSTFLGATPTYIGVPILLKEHILGTFSVFDKDAQRLRPEELALLEAIAAQIGIVVESARLRRRAAQAAVGEERDRLAREIHDGLAQDLASLRLRVDVWQNLAETNSQKLRAELDRAKQILGNSIRDVRHSIFALRPLLLNEGGFFAAVEQFTTGFGEQHDLRVAWRVLGPRERLASLWEPILIHIIQEALNNTSKHAHAKSVAITLDLESAACLALTIQDDGIGFDPNCLNEPLSGERRGLAQMREQVKRLDGTFRLRSLPGQGTEIRIILPWEQ